MPLSEPERCPWLRGAPAEAPVGTCRHPTDEPDKPHPFRKKRNWTPPRNANIRLEAYIEANNLELESQYPIKQLHSNLSQEENSLIKLKLDKTIVIKPADKGGALT